MSMGTEPTPPQIRLRQADGGAENMYEANSQLRRQGVPVQDVVRFEETVRAARDGGVILGQVNQFNKGAEAIGAEIHWIN